MQRSNRRVVVPRPDRIRTIAGVAFGWIDARILRDTWLAALSPEETEVYLFLCLVADRQGTSYYRKDRIAHRLGLDIGDVHRVLRGLMEKDLVAFEPFQPGATDGFHQVLSWPASGPPAPDARIAALWRPNAP